MKRKYITKSTASGRSNKSLPVGGVTQSFQGHGSLGDYLQAIIDSLEDELMVIDRDYSIIEVNKAVLRRHGKRRKEVIGRYCHDISHGLLDRCQPPHHECPIKARLGDKQTSESN
jgi:PAS domain-containing protein